MAALTIYTLKSCPTCAKAKADLGAEGIEYEERKIDENGAYYEEACDLGFSVPIIVRDGKVEVGWKGESG